MARRPSAFSVDRRNYTGSCSNPPGRDGEVEIEGILITSEREADCSFAMTSYCGLPLDLRELPEADRLFAALVGLHS